MRKEGSPVKTLVLVSGDVHHSYCMTANPSDSGRPTPEILQITCSGLQTTIRGSKKAWLAEQLATPRSTSASAGWCRASFKRTAPAAPIWCCSKTPSAMVDVSMGTEVDVMVTYLTASMDVRNQMRQIYKYTSHPSYLKSNGEAAVAL